MQLLIVKVAVPTCVLAAVPGAGHLAPLEQPDRCAEAVRQFLVGHG